VVGTDAEELNIINLEDQTLPQILGYTSYVHYIPSVEIVISLNKILLTIIDTN